jgi:ribose 5-phosphate isomerase A
LESKPSVFCNLRLFVAREGQEFHEIVECALDMVRDGNIVGLGTGRTATAFIEALGARARAGLRIRGVPTSEGSAALARQLGIPLANLDDITSIDIDFDGADEVDPRLDLIKGYGNALVREKIVAAAAKQVVILVGPEKIVPVLGNRGRLPVEVVPFGLGFCRRQLMELGYPSTPRSANEKLVVSDNGNYILDCQVGPIPDPARLDSVILSIPGVVGTGLFVGMANIVLVQREGKAEILRGNKK